jgi:hypothetical protein
MKTCTKCGQEKPFALFSKNGKTKDGYQHHCKQCKLDYQRSNSNRSAVTAKYREANKEICNARSAVSMRKKPEYYASKSKKWAQQNPEKIHAAKVRHKQKVLANGGIPEEVRLRKNAAASAYRKINRERVEATLKICRANWLNANKERYKAIQKAYRMSEAGKAKTCEWTALYVLNGGRARADARRVAKPKTDACKEATLRYQIRRRTNDTDLKEFDYFVLAEAVRLRKLREKMLNTKWDVDHVIPVSKGGSSHAENLQVVPASWNRQKSNKHSEWFFPRA